MFFFDLISFKKLDTNFVGVVVLAIIENLDFP